MTKNKIDPAHKLLHMLIDADRRTEYSNDFLDLTGFEHITLEWCLAHPLV